jgi:4'-phosphopantetheinyl transferase EntD
MPIAGEETEGAVPDVNEKMLMAGIVPTGTRCYEQVGIPGGSLLPREAELLSARTVSKRREEFAAGRTCARNALDLLGVPQMPILRGKQNEPLWPKGVVGSITHCKGYCAAAVTFLNLCGAIGIDAEPNESLPSDVLGLIARQREQEWILNANNDEICWDRLLFCIKESIYKVWYPLERRWLDFDQAEVEIQAETSTFKAALLCPTSICPHVIEGRFCASDSLLLACASVPGIIHKQESILPVFY